MGARYQENIYFSEEASEQEVSSAQQSANSNAFEVSGSISGTYKGVTAEASASHGEQSESSSESSNSSSSHQSESVSRGGMRQFGQINASGKCGELLGEDNILFPVEYETEPLYKLVNPRKFPRQRQLLESLLSTMITQGKECAQKECSSKGTCVVDQFFFDREYKGLGY